MRIFTLLLALIATSCASASAYKEAAPQEAYGGDMADMDADGILDGSRGGGERVAQAEATPGPEVRTDAPPAANKRLIIYTANFAIMVSSAKTSVDKFVAAVEAAGGYLGSRRDQEVVARVPAEKFHELVASLEDYGAITSRTVQAQDVTAAFRDLRIRIENAERARDRLLKLLADAKQTKDLLEIERELRRLTEEIERMKGQLRHMGDQIAYSTLTVRFLEDAPNPRPVNLRRESRFRWINKIGVENALERF